MKINVKMDLPFHSGLVCPDTLLQALEFMFTCQCFMVHHGEAWFNYPQKVHAWEKLRKSCQWVSGWLEHGKMDARDKPRVKQYLDQAEAVLTKYKHLEKHR
jgi:hypothetical protein